jgi:hypothetical protein
MPEVEAALVPEVEAAPVPEVGRGEGDQGVLVPGWAPSWTTRGDAKEEAEAERW